MVYKEVIKSFLKNYKYLPRITGSLFSLYKSGSSSYAFPLRAQIENSTICNLSCRMCPLPSMKRKRGFMTLAQFKKIYDILKPPFLNLTGYGESFLNKDIFKMVSYANKNGSYVKFDSNGTLLGKNEINKVFECGLNLLSFSLDGATKKTYEQIRIGSQFEKVISGIKALIREKRRRKSPLKIHLAMVVQTGNVHELNDLIKLGERLGVDKINPTPIVEYDIRGNKKFLLDKYKKELKKAIEEFLLKRGKINVEVDIAPLVDFLKEESKKKICFIPWYSTYISWEGDVFPCCYYYNGQIKFGNIFKESFDKIWNSQSYRLFRERLRERRNDLPICKACSIDEKFIYQKMNLLLKIPLIGGFSNRRP